MLPATLHGAPEAWLLLACGGNYCFSQGTGCPSDSLGFSTTADGFKFMAEIHMKCVFCLFSFFSPISGKSTDGLYF